MNAQCLKRGLVASGLMNVGGVLVLSRLFTNTAINAADPVVMSNFGLLMIVVWGLVFVASSQLTAHVRWLMGAFAVEKLVYAAVWLRWLSEHSLASVYAQDAMAGVFYTIYGVNDLTFLLFFVWAFVALGKGACAKAHG